MYDIHKPPSPHKVSYHHSSDASHQHRKTQPSSPPRGTTMSAAAISWWHPCAQTHDTFENTHTHTHLKTWIGRPSLTHAHKNTYTHAHIRTIIHSFTRTNNYTDTQTHAHANPCIQTTIRMYQTQHRRYPQIHTYTHTRIHATQCRNRQVTACSWAEMFLRMRKSSQMTLSTDTSSEEEPADMEKDERRRTSLSLSLFPSLHMGDSQEAPVVLFSACTHKHTHTHLHTHTNPHCCVPLPRLIHTTPIGRERERGDGERTPTGTWKPHESNMGVHAPTRHSNATQVCSYGGALECVRL